MQITLRIILPKFSRFTLKYSVYTPSVTLKITHLSTKCIFILISYENERFNRLALVLDSFSVFEFSVDLPCGIASLGIVSDFSRHLFGVIVTCQNFYWTFRHKTTTLSRKVGHHLHGDAAPNPIRTSPSTTPMWQPKNINIYLEVGIQSLNIYELLCYQQGNSTHEKANLADFHVHDTLYITGSVLFCVTRPKECNLIFQLKGFLSLSLRGIRVLHYTVQGQYYVDL
jgi:hypothetical protein